MNDDPTRTRLLVQFEVEVDWCAGRLIEGALSNEARRGWFRWCLELALARFLAWVSGNDEWYGNVRVVAGSVTAADE